MNKKKKYLLIAGIVVIVAAAALVFYRVNENIKSSKRPAPPPQTVKVIQPERGDIASKIVVSGDILPIQQTNIYSRVTGNIQKIYADIGDYVQQGKLLATIDKSVFLQTERQTEGLLNQAIATLENNKVNLTRTQTLFDKGLAPQGDLDNAVTLVKVSEAQVETAKANHNNAALQVSYCNITAPFSGYITKRFLDQGALVSSNVSQGTSNSIFILSDISKLKILVNVLEKDIPQLDNVKDVNITLDAYPGEIFHGLFRKMSQAEDLNTRTMPVQVDIENKDRLLKPGMFAKVELLLDIHYGSLIVPEQSVLKDDKGKFVYAINPDTTTVKKYVQTGVNSDNKMEIVSGLNESDMVVFVGQELIQENSKVKISQ
jgi:membrane fusion protein, multidrug efflux system